MLFKAEPIVTMSQKDFNTMMLIKKEEGYREGLKEGYAYGYNQGKFELPRNINGLCNALTEILREVGHEVVSYVEKDVDITRMIDRTVSYIPIDAIMVKNKPMAMQIILSRKLADDVKKLIENKDIFTWDVGGTYEN